MASPQNLIEAGAPVGPRLSYSIKEASQVIGVTPWTVHTAIAEGRLSAKRLGKKWIVTRPDLETFLKNLPTISPSQQWLEKRKKAVAS